MCCEIQALNLDFCEHFYIDYPTEHSTHNPVLESR